MLDVSFFLLGLNVNAVAAAGGGGGGYTAQAVHYDTDTVVLGNMTGTDGPLLGMSVWFTRDNTDTASFFQADNGPTIAINSDVGNHIYVGVNSADFAGPSGGVGAGVNWLSAETVSAGLSDWHHLLIGADCSDANTANWKIVGYLDDVALSFSPQLLDLGGGPQPYIYGPGPLNMGMFNCAMQIVDWSGIVTSENVADLFIFAGQSLLTGSDIALATRRLFIDGSGKPVDPATAVAALGSPTMLFSGDHTGFVTNQGSGGGAFAVSEGALTNATTSPSD